MLSPKRACLAQARVAETGQVHTRALAQAESSHLSEVTSRSSERGSPKRERVGTLARCCSLSPGEKPHLWARGGLAHCWPKRERVGTLARRCSLA